MARGKGKVSTKKAKAEAVPEDLEKRNDDVAMDIAQQHGSTERVDSSHDAELPPPLRNGGVVGNLKPVPSLDRLPDLVFQSGNEGKMPDGMFFNRMWRSRFGGPSWFGGAGVPPPLRLRDHPATVMHNGVPVNIGFDGKPITF